MCNRTTINFLDRSLWQLRRGSPGTELIPVSQGSDAKCELACHTRDYGHRGAGMADTKRAWGEQGDLVVFTMHAEWSAAPSYHRRSVLAPEPAVPRP